MDSQDRPCQTEQCYRVRKVQNDEQLDAPETPVDHRDRQHDIDSYSENSNCQEANKHGKELAMVQQAYAVVEPPAVVIKPSDRSFVLPRLVGTLWQGYLANQG
mmetsp:Transcript_124267/g.247675  ORF Transcript_124267/g.247675 Transcript_124267/m.247675 type:complete len:103 (-) Transcript_124267:260-568(-)|eukprot:CAMPEP_0172862078 /NCGR_PEP_ID=MMETSP1075-20121228/73183_1 /TAXON_ID=2916 /ORGANISM="Ceratium fusus, Strain PA161109" /LENGTH=102 /DNA_ID=CAMNT_0013710293 /DNA_START=277 /DNA_END=585 /DNA_ORIENTATION=+